MATWDQFYAGRWKMRWSRGQKGPVGRVFVPLTDKPREIRGQWSKVIFPARGQESSACTEHVQDVELVRDTRPEEFKRGALIVRPMPCEVCEYIREGVLTPDMCLAGEKDRLYNNGQAAELARQYKLWLTAPAWSGEIPESGFPAFFKSLTQEARVSFLRHHGVEIFKDGQDGVDEYLALKWPWGVNTPPFRFVGSRKFLETITNGVIA